MPAFHDCQRCTACCRWPGQVRLSELEISRISAFLQLAENEFIQSHTRLRHDRRGLALKEQADGACVFLKDNLCAIQSVKPQQCRDFPNLWKYPDAENTAAPFLVKCLKTITSCVVSQATSRSPDEIRAIVHLRAQSF